MAPDRDTLRAAVAERLGARSLQHSERVAAAAAGLAAEYGVDTDDAWVAGLLHDWDKELGHDRLIQAARADGIPVTEVDERVPYLLHARTAACDVARAFPDLSPRIIDAIGRHTVGSAEMTPLDAVVFIADMIEPERAWSGVDELRTLVGTVSLDDLFFAAYRRSITHLIDTGKLIHPDTIAVWNALAGGGVR